MKGIGITLFVILVVGIGGIFLLSRGSSSGGVTSGSEQVPDLTFQDYEGNDVVLKDLVGKPLVINSWAVWCPFCLRELSAFAEVQREFGEEILIIAVDRAEPLSTVKRYTDDLNVTNTILFLLDPSDSFYRAINGFSMPETIFVDANGVIQEHKRGPMEVDEIRRKVQSLLNS